MPRYRGLGDVERLAIDFITVTATGTALAFPCAVYSINGILSSTTTSGQFSVADTTSSGDVGLESVRWDFKFGSSAASANSEWHYPRMFNPPIGFTKQVCVNLSTGMQAFSIGYLAMG